MSSVRVEFLVEPFSEGAPGPHVLAAIDAARGAGLEPEVGPFGTSVVLAGERVGRLLGDVVDAALAAGATRVALQVERAAG
jgi:uncharacterized protein YqgV (UPF0045/DUF77 family)